MKRLRTTFFVILFTSFLPGCFDNLNPANKSTNSSNKTSSITSAQFSGAASATNKIAGILVTWPAVIDPSLVKAYRVYRGSGTSQALVASLAPSITSYMDGTTEPGSIYTYMVKAVDQNNLEDNNTKTVKSLSWAGISSVSGSSRKALQVNFVNPAAVVDEVRVYGQLAVGGPKTLLGISSGNDTSILLDGLRTGYTYIISAQAYVASLGKEDGNDLTYTATTYTSGYDADGADLPKWANVMSIRAFGEAPAAPIHPVTPNKSPNQRVVELAFNEFTGVGTGAKYVVTRAIDGFTLDSSVSTACTDTTFTSCRACDSLTASNGVVFCRDTAVAASPARYRYSISMVQVDSSSGDTWVEPLPLSQDVLSQFSVLVPIPPKNMVLAQRDAVNYEMCLQLKKPSDPQNFNRCTYSGIGAVPYSTGNDKPPLNLSNGYYDFGYNLFVDRWQMACNWTRSANGGMCGPNHTPGDCIGFGATVGVGAPQPSQGKVGDVYFWMTQSSMSSCYIATSQDSTGAITWMHPASILSNIGNSAGDFQNMFTNDPGYVDSSNAYHTDIPGLRAKTTWNNTPDSASAACKAQFDPNYGQKRMSRAREYVAYSAPAILSNEPYTVGSYLNFMNKILKTNALHDGNNNYGCEAGTVLDTPPANLSQLLDYASYPSFKEMTFIKGTDAAGNNGTFGGLGNSGAFMIGAVATIDCQSRYGVQDVMDTTMMSDVTYFNQTTFKSTGIMSPYDNGNKDFLSDLNGGNSGFVFDLSQFASNGYLSQTSSTLTAIIPSLGLPITATTYSTNYVPKGLITQPYVTQWGAPPSTYNTGVYSTRISSRWSFGMNYSTKTTNAGGGSNRCVLPAE